MQPRIELGADLTATCCSTLQYLEGAAYIAVVLAVLGAPQLLTYYFDQRDRRRAGAEDRAEAERVRRDERAAAEQVRRDEHAAAEQVRRDERAAAEQVRREERAESERRHQEMMTALIALLERNGLGSPNQSELIEQLRHRIAELEAEVTLLRNGSGGNLTHGSASE